jgi:pyruvate/2-oxoglutarate dehydrogenase complex dihydrolipoamide dehydrogenase (E3) component
VAKLRGVDIDGKRVVTSDQAIARQVPQRLLVIGAGVIGQARLSVAAARFAGNRGQFLDRILPGMDNEVCAIATYPGKAGIVFKLGR